MLPLPPPPPRVRGWEGHLEEKISGGGFKKGPCACYPWPNSAGGSRDLLEVAPKCERIRQHQGICHPPTPPKSHLLPAQS